MYFIYSRGLQRPGGRRETMRLYSRPPANAARAPRAVRGVDAVRMANVSVWRYCAAMAMARSDISLLMTACDLFACGAILKSRFGSHNKRDISVSETAVLATAVSTILCEKSRFRAPNRDFCTKNLRFFTALNRDRSNREPAPTAIRFKPRSGSSRDF